MTHFREQAEPEASQPVLHADDLLQGRHVPSERDRSLRRSLEELSLGGCRRDADGQVTRLEPPLGGRPWGYGFVFALAGEMSWSDGLQEAWRLAPRWLYVMRG